MSDVHILAIDLAKRSFQVCATDRGGAVLFNRTVSRAKLMQMLNGHEPCIVAMEACATSHHWGRVAQSGGHDVRLVSPIYVKPFVKRQKNDAADAAAIAEAVLRPNIHCVAVKSAEHQARAVTFRTHQCFVRQRTQLINALRATSQSSAWSFRKDRPISSRLRLRWRIEQPRFPTPSGRWRSSTSIRSICLRRRSTI